MRVKIHGYVTARPGVHMGDLVRDLGLGWGNAHHHLDHMERRAQIIREAEGNRVRLFIPGQVPGPMRHAFAVLKNECLRDTFRIVAQRSGIIQRDVATALGVTPTAARKHLRRLTDEGLIRAERVGNRVRYRATADAIGLELRMWLRDDRLGEASPKRAHPNDPATDDEQTHAPAPESARFDTTHEMARRVPAEHRDEAPPQTEGAARQDEAEAERERAEARIRARAGRDPQGDDA